MECWDLCIAVTGMDRSQAAHAVIAAPVTQVQRCYTASTSWSPGLRIFLLTTPSPRVGPADGFSVAFVPDYSGRSAVDSHHLPIEALGVPSLDLLSIRLSKPPESVPPGYGYYTFVPIRVKNPPRVQAHLEAELGPTWFRGAKLTNVANARGHVSPIREACMRSSVVARAIFYADAPADSG